MTDDQFAALEKIESWLTYAADTDHDWCEDPDCDIDNPCCRDMHAKRALRDLRKQLEPTHDGLHPKRLTGYPERIYLEEWRKQNVRHAGVNHGFTTIEHVLCPEGQKRPERINEHDANIVATLIQWLGTNCGRSFIWACEARIENARQERQAFEDALHKMRWSDGKLEDSFLREIAIKVADCHFTPETEKHRLLQQNVMAAFKAVGSTRRLIKNRESLDRSIDASEPVLESGT